MNIGLIRSFRLLTRIIVLVQTRLSYIHWRRWYATRTDQREEKGVSLFDMQGAYSHYVLTCPPYMEQSS